MFRSIVAMIDRAPEADACVREAAELAERTGARLTLFAAVPRVHPVSATLWAAPVVPPETPRSLRQACERECEALLRRAAEGVPAAVPVTMSVRAGRWHAVLLREVRERGHDLVVLDAGRPRGLRFARWRFLRRCPIPVLFLPRSASEAVVAGRPKSGASVQVAPARPTSAAASGPGEGIAAPRRRPRGVGPFREARRTGG